MLLKSDLFLVGAGNFLPEFLVLQLRIHDALRDGRDLLARAGLDEIAKRVEELGLDTLALQIVDDIRHAAGRVDEAGQSHLLTFSLHVLAEKVSFAVKLPDDSVEACTGRETLSDVLKLAHVHMVSVVLNALELSIHISKGGHW